ncbi:MAG: UDP-N-acetylglucosamine 2-epimerase (non-hydrolyzing) [Clostridia bacterium]|nr:UDP-N-acetylglucosamine 2-epimerase (non-hydrolyzing) [Clostridia bacterium]
MHYLFVFGTRPEAIKLLPLAKILRARGARVTLLSTAQHTDLLSSALDAFDMSCDLTLPPLPRDRTLTDLMRHFSSYLPRHLRALSPDATIVQGDTISAFCGALSSFLLRIPVVHIEAGLRTYNSASPYPEEALRRMIAPLATVHFTTSDIATEHLRCEGISENIFTVGNTVWDAMHLLCPRPSPKEPPYAIVTTHRRESDGARREGMFRAISRLASMHKDLSFFVVINENPTIRSMAQAIVSGKKNITLLPPQSPHAFYDLLAGASLVLTDSGGVSEESAALCIPTFVLRDMTEREWEVREGKLILSGTEEEKIVDIVSTYIRKGIPKERSFGMPKASPSEKIADILQRITL